MRGKEAREKPSRASLGDTAYLRLRQMIVSGELQAGARVLENDCAARLGISRTPIREAIGRLTSEGLIRRPEGGAPVVHRISTDEIVEILHVRRLLEVEAARQAAGASGRDALLRLRSIFEGFLSGERPTAEAHSAADDALHEQIAKMSGSRLLESLISDMRLKTRIFDKGSIPERFEPGCREHIAIIDGIVSGDPERAQAAMKTHMDNVREGILNHLTRLF